MYKALIVDDKALIRKGIISSIDWKGLNVELAGEAENGEYALDMINRTRPDIVITDIRMPDMDGIELLKSICELGSQIVTIVISGYDDFEYAKKAIKYGSIDYIMKPIDPAELNGSLKKACSILDKNKVYTPTNEQLLRDFFQKTIKEIKYNPLEYKALYEDYHLDNCLYCAAIIKAKAGKAIFEDFSQTLNDVKVCPVEDSNGIITVIFFNDCKSISPQSFEMAVLRSVRKLVENNRNEETISGIGQVAENPDNLANSYKTACEAAFYCMLPESENMRSYSQVANRKALSIRLDEYESELVVNITSGNANKSVQILERLFDRVISFPDISMESVRQLFRNLCYILVKLNVGFESEIYGFLDKLGMPEYLLKYESIDSLTQVVYNFYNFAIRKYLDEAGGKNSVVTKVKNFIEKNYSGDISLNKLSDLFHINASYLTRIFKEEERYSINEYIIKVRVENAKKILEQGKVNIQKLAEAVGYEDSTYFFKVFKKVTGMTPREYLLNNKQR